MKYILFKNNKNMGCNEEIMKKDLSFEEFKELACNIPKRFTKTIFCLEEIDLRDDIEDIKYPEFDIYRHLMGFFETKQMAETGMKDCISKAQEEKTDIYCFKLYELPLNQVTNLNNFPYICNIREYLYDSKGIEIDHTVCSSLDEDVFTEYGSYLGKPKENIRVKEGDLVEIIGTDTVTLGIVSHDPINTEWCYDLYKRVRKKGDYPYTLDYSDDQTTIVDGSEYGNHSHIQLCDMMKPRFPVPDEIRKRFEDYLIQSQTPH